MSQRATLSSRFWLILLCSLLVGLTAAWADASPDASSSADSDGGTSADAEDDASATASTQAGSGGQDAGFLSKLQIHGFLTQAIAQADFVEQATIALPDGSRFPIGPSPSQFELALGIPNDEWTTNYRFLALQFRYDMSDKDAIVIQFSSRTLGFSPFQNFEDEVELDWAFYERSLTDFTSLKIGRVQIPFGIYNEVRDVGTVLPFYRPAFLFYKEASFTSETVDGLSLSHTFFPESDWSLEFSGYLGEWSSIIIDPPNPENSAVVRAKEGYGYQLWLNLPISAIRIGTGLLSFEQEDSAQLGIRAPERRDIYHASLDANFDRFTFQAEWNQEKSPLFFPGNAPFDLNISEWYVLAGIRATEKLSFWGQYESGELSWDSPLLIEPFGVTQREDLGFSINYAFKPNLMLKMEHHLVEETAWTFLPTDFTNPFSPLFGFVAEAEDGNYSIVSLAVSF